MKQRILTSIGIVAALIVVIFSTTYTKFIFDIFIGLIAISGALEFSKLLSKCGRYNSQIVIGLFPSLAYALMLLSLYLNLGVLVLFALELALVIGVFAIYFLVLLIFKKYSYLEISTRKLKISLCKFAFTKSMNTLAGCIYPSLALLMLVVLNRIDMLSSSLSLLSGTLPKLSIFVLTITFASPIFVDTFAMFTGMIFGGKKLVPSLSPNKTIAGAIGGVVWGTLISALIFVIFNAFPSFLNFFSEKGIEIWQFIIYGFISAFVSQAGDLFESFIKRRANVKDSGDFLPGHGGILDRIDSHTFNAVFSIMFFLILFA